MQMNDRDPWNVKRVSKRTVCVLISRENTTVHQTIAQVTQKNTHAKGKKQVCDGCAHLHAPAGLTGVRCRFHSEPRLTLKSGVQRDMMGIARGGRQCASLMESMNNITNISLTETLMSEHSQPRFVVVRIPWQDVPA